jgi:deoxyxylulose-5-phosphate synthase
LKHQIQQEVKWIPVEMLQRVMVDVRKRLTKCVERNGGHLNDVIFGK